MPEKPRSVAVSPGDGSIALEMAQQVSAELEGLKRNVDTIARHFLAMKDVVGQVLRENRELQERLSALEEKDRG